MNKTLSIGLAGFSFTIEEHAYIKLSDYLAALRNSLDATEADEVMHDIEIRMVEIFRNSLGKREVINDDDVEKVIAQIGTPEKIGEQEEAYFSEGTTKSKANNQQYNNGKKQLFRDPENAKLAGVCAGLAHYTGMDISVMRAIWLGIAILGIFTAAISTTLIVIIYIILWAVLPVAQSTSDFLKMKGKPVNFDTIKEESNKIVQFANDSGKKVGEMYNDTKPYINNAGSGLWNVIRYILGGIFGFTAVCFLMGSFFIFGFWGNDNFPPVGHMSYLFADNGMKYVLMGIIVLGSLIPAILFGLLSLKLISPSTKVRNIGWVLGTLFIALIFLSTYFGINMAKQDMFLTGTKEDTEEVLINTQSDSLYIDVKQVTIPQNFKSYDDDLYYNEKEVFEEDYISVNIIRKTDVKTPYLIIKKEAKGYNIPIDLSVPVEIVNNKVLLPNYVKYPYEQRFRDYHVDYELVVPQTTVIIPVKNDRINFDGDLDGDGINDDDDTDNDQANLKIEKNKITINGSTIEYNENDKDSVIVNGKKVSKKEADSIIDKSDIDFENLKDVDIQIKDGKKEISIKANK